MKSTFCSLKCKQVNGSTDGQQRGPNDAREKKEHEEEIEKKKGRFIRTKHNF